MRRMSPLVALIGHRDGVEECPLLGVKRTSQFDRATSAFDPTRTSATKFGAMHTAQLLFIDARVPSSAEGNAHEASGHHRRRITSITPGAMKKVAGADLGLIRTHVERKEIKPLLVFPSANERKPPRRMRQTERY